MKLLSSLLSGSPPPLPPFPKVKINYLCTCDLYGPVLNVFDVGTGPGSSLMILDRSTGEAVRMLRRDPGIK